MKTFKRFDVIKMAAVLRPEGAVCHGRNKGKGRREAFPSLFRPEFRSKTKTFWKNWKVAKLMPLFHGAQGHTRKLQAS